MPASSHGWAKVSWLPFFHQTTIFLFYEHLTLTFFWNFLKVAGSNFNKMNLEYVHRPSGLVFVRTVIKHATSKLLIRQAKIRFSFFIIRLLKRECFFCRDAGKITKLQPVWTPPLRVEWKGVSDPYCLKTPPVPSVGLNSLYLVWTVPTALGERTALFFR